MNGIIKFNLQLQIKRIVIFVSLCIHKKVHIFSHSACLSPLELDVAKKFEAFTNHVCINLFLLRRSLYRFIHTFQA